MSRRRRIPRFPTFKRIELADRPEAEELTSGFAPYSDFNFVSLWCWDTDGLCQLSRLNDNLVVKFKDYGSGAMLLSVLGANATLDTVTALLAYAERHGIEPGLRLVPEVVATDRALAGAAAIVEDPGSFDYVLSVQEWVELRGGKFRNKRNLIRGFERKHAPEFRVLDLGCREVQQEMVRLFLLWSDKKQRFGLEETRNELMALRRAFGLAADGQLLSVGVYVDGVMRGFSVNQVLDDGYAIGHFWKADHSYSGIYAYMLHRTCRELAERGVARFNIEQDLGKSGLAYSKWLYRPCLLLRKYQISRPAPAVAAPPAARSTKPLVLPHRSALAAR